MIRRSLGLVFALTLLVGVLYSYADDSSPVVKLDPALDKIVASGAKLEKLLDGHGFFEGPTWVHTTNPQYLLFTDIPGGVINKWTPDGNLSVVVDHIFTGTDTSGLAQYPLGDKKLPMIGADGTTLDREGRIVFCGFGPRAVIRVEKDGSRTVLADRFEGKKFNTPNDLVYKSDGTLYFTDTQADQKRAETDPEKGVSFSGVYSVKGGKLQLVTKDLTGPNGLAFSPGEKYLYINESPKKRITRFDVQPDDSVSNPKLIIDMNADKAEGMPDGMKVDKDGNIYCTGPGGLWIMSPDGKHIGTILTPQRLSNLTFGDKDGKTLYMTAPQGLYRIHLKVAGIRP